MKRIFVLDIFRGLAAISVLLFHYTTKFNSVFKSDLMSAVEFPHGHYGVHLFFIISGFVIFMTLERLNSGKEFLKRRFIRLYPTFWLCLLITFSISSLAGISQFKRSIIELFINFTMIPSLLRTKPVDGAYWSLEVELLFYFLMFLIVKMGRKGDILIFNIFWLIISIFISYFKIPYLNVLLITDYSYLFIAGISFYKLWSDSNKISNHFIIVLCLMYGFIIKGVEEGVVVSLFLILFYLFIHGSLEFLRSFRFLTFFGNISYPFYLLHQVIGMILIHKLSYFSDNYIVLIIAPFAMITLMSWLVTKYAEPKLKTIFTKVIKL